MNLKAPTLEGSMNQLRTDNIPFIDVAAQRRRLGPAVDEAVYLGFMGRRPPKASSVQAGAAGNCHH